ncbi:MAG: AAA family ATPase [Candidatus Dormibacteria bacterium]
MAIDRLDLITERAIADVVQSEFLERAPVTVELSDVVAQQVGWLWGGWIPLARLSLCIGHAGQGKSWLSLAIAAAVSRGWPLPGDVTGEPGDVLLIGAEDGLADTVRPRLDALGADVRRIVALEGVRTRQGERGFRLADCDVLEQALSVRPYQLVVIDPLTAFAGHTDSYKDAEVRTLLAPLAKLAEEYGPAVLGIMHLRKGQADTALQRASGSIAWGAAARSVFAVGTDPQANDASTERHVLPVKQNLCAPPEGVTFELDGGHFAWGGPSGLSAAQLMAARGEEGGAIAEAKDVLRQILADGPVESNAALAQCRAAGVSESTANRARRALGVRATKEGYGAKGKWLLDLPDGEHQAAPPTRRTVSGNDYDLRSERPNASKGFQTSAGERLSALAPREPPSTAPSTAPASPSVATALRVFPGSRLVGSASHRAATNGHASEADCPIDVPPEEPVVPRPDA